ncbi:hypothetical protein BGX26_012404 [Mortierella sp. AD094]|nr:hypothetical protein BGX26_012404 [Mortierella sp. AD094]
MIRNLFSSPSRELSLIDVLELANEHLESARNATAPTKALLLCDGVKAAIKEAENIIANKRVDGQTLNDDIANAYHEHGKLLEALGQPSKAQKSYSKAKKWGYIHVTSLQTGSSPPNHLEDSIHQSFPPLAAFSAAPPITAAVHQKALGDSNPPILQSLTKGMAPSGTEILKPVTIEDTAQDPQMIFDRDITPLATKFTLPGLGGCITSAPQLAYCLSLLNHSLASKEGLDKTECDWLQAMRNNIDEQERLQTLAVDLIRAFVRDELKGPDVVAETVSLAAVLEQHDFRKLLGVFVDGVEQSVLLEIHLLDGLAFLMKNAPQNSLDADDLVKILELLGVRLKGTHQQSTQHTYRLALTISRVLDSMVDSQVEGLQREKLHEPLSQFLEELQQSSDPCLVYQAAYAYQALQYIPDEETILQAMLRRTGKVVYGISGVVSAVRALDLNNFIDGLQHIQEGLAGATKAISVVNDACQNAMTLTESGQGFLGSLKEGLSLSRKSAWYPALRGLDTLLQESRLTEFEKLIREAPCRHDPAFQWGVCQRLGDLASNATWDFNIRQSAISFLGEMYTNDAWWDHQITIKQWILQILNNLTKSSERAVASHVEGLLQDFESDGKSEKRALYRAIIKDGQDSYTLITNSLPLHESRLLNSIQNKADVETPLRQLKYERLRNRDNEVYVSPRAKLHASAKDSFDLTSKVQEFLSSNKKVFLLLGDSGAGKSTFNRALEIELWNNYDKVNGRIPLFIHLPAIDKPEQGLIDKQLHDLDFTENQIRELKLHREFIVICDGYDESQQTRNLYTSNRLNQPGGWRAQMVISCRTEYIGADYKNCFQPTDRNSGGNSELFQEVIVAPFNKDQIQDYIDRYVVLREPTWKSEDYQKALKQIPNLQDLATNPFLLKLSLEVLPRLLNTNSEFSEARITRVELYDEFVVQWVERGQIRLRDMELSPRDKEAFKILSDSGFNQECIAYIKKLATAIYDNQGGNPVVEYSERRDQRTWKKPLFNNIDGKNLLREAIPLIRNSGHYRFIHKSVLEYALTLAVFDPSAHDESKEPSPNPSRRGSTSSVLSFEEPSLIVKPATGIEQSLLDSPFGRKSFVDDASISQFLVERAQQQPVFNQQLHAVIERSKTEKAARVAAANAITVLVRAGVQFVGADLRDIKVPGADLSYGMFDSAQLDGADLRKANLCNIWLRKASLCGVQMAGVRFGELPFILEYAQVGQCAYSRDGQILAVGRKYGDISLYETSSRRKVRTLKGHTKGIRCLLFSETGGRFASGSEDGRFRLWDVETGNCVQTLDCGDIVLAIATYSPNGYHVASRRQSKILQLWNTTTSHCFLVLQGHSGTIQCAAYSPKGDQVASGSEDKTVRLWSVDTGNCVHILEGHDHLVHTIAYSPDGCRIASGGMDLTIRLWNVEAGDCIRTLHGHDGSVYSLMYSPNGDQIASGNYDQTVKLWNVETGDCINTLQGHGGSVNSAVYSPNGSEIASGSFDQTVRLWKVETSSFSRNVQGHSGMVVSVAYSPNKDRVASASSDKTVRLWDVETGKCLRALQGHMSPVFCVAYSPKGDRIASGSEDRTARLWDVETGSCVHTFQGHITDVRSIAFSPKGDRVASGSYDKTVRLWDVETGNCVYTLCGHNDRVVSIEFSPNGEQIASGSGDKTMRLWDIETGTCVHTLQGHDGLVRSVAYSPNGDHIASGSFDKTVRLWDVKGSKCIYILNGHNNSVWNIAYSPKGDQIASGSNDKTVRLWNIGTGSCVQTLRGHSDGILVVAYSSDGDRIASGSTDKTVRLWDVETGKFLVAITGFSGDVVSIVWQDTFNGHYIVTGSRDKSVRRWRITKERDEYQVHLCWSSSNDGLVVAEATLKDVQGLSQVNWELLKQRGALITSPPSI